jgi:nucleotide-binding universal stress UspA family protein
MSQTPASRSIPTKILLPMDFSPCSDAALSMATDLAQHFRAELHLVHVVPMIPMKQLGLMPTLRARFLLK